MTLQVAVNSRNLPVSPNLRATVEQKVNKLTRFLDGMDQAEVTFSEEKNPRIAERDVCEVTLHGHGQVVRAKAAAADPFAAVDRVIDKLEHRLEKLKGKLVGRSHPRRQRAASVNSAAAPQVVGRRTERPRIVKTKQIDPKPMTQEEALLQMELLGRDFFLFSTEKGGAAVIYHRGDGDIGLIEAP